MHASHETVATPDLVVGIVGGMGPQATDDFRIRLRAEARRQDVNRFFNTEYSLGRRSLPNLPQRFSTHS